MLNQCLFRVSGRVQGVGFRYHTQMEAIRLGLKGYAINLSDGDVEVLLDGEQEQIDKMIKWLLHGPPLARVEKLESIALEKTVVVSDFRTN